MSKYFIMNSGKRIYLDNMSENDINLNDIAHHLTKICRYGGGLNLNYHYSVASHSIALYYYAVDKGLPFDLQRNLLMHDATEAYLGDINGILKGYLPDYQSIEEKVRLLIWGKYKLSTCASIEANVNLLDKRILLDEARVFYRDNYNNFSEQYGNMRPLGVSISPDYNLAITKSMFLKCCDQLDIFD